MALIETMPTKAFFVDMLVRDILLERAILDLVDNSVDGAKRQRPGTPTDYSGLGVEIVLGANSFMISDNCGGFDIDTAANYAFRFGRARGAATTPFSVGQFGVGMKRALFKFGSHFTVSSKTATESWRVDVPVDVWEAKEDWHFEFESAQRDLTIAVAERGTTIVVDKLRPEVATKLGSEHFQRTVAEIIRTHQRQFLAAGLTISLNGLHLVHTDLKMAVGDVAPGIDEFEDAQEGKKTIRVRIVCGAGDSKPTDAGWYVVCNGRVVLAADRTDVTGWGRVAEQSEEIPKYHNQYARFRGIVYFDCEDAGRLPWNTTKDGVDADSPAWRNALEKMLVLARAVINFLNEVDREVEQHGRDGPMQRALASSPRQDVDLLVGTKAFRTPDPQRYTAPPRTRITYSKENDKIEYLKEALGVYSAKAVGERTFDDAYREQKGEQ